MEDSFTSCDLAQHNACDKEREVARYHKQHRRLVDSLSQRGLQGGMA